MTTQQLIEKKKKDINKLFNAYGINNIGFKNVIKSLFDSFALELIETVSEEIIGKNDNVVKTAHTNFDGTRECIFLARYELRKEQRHHKDEIINSIKKND